ncbi:MAG: glucosylglycerol hydrolase, partial [Pseudomonadota bacterium]
MDGLAPAGPRLHEAATEAMAEDARRALAEAPTAYEAAQTLARRLGAQPGPDGICEIGFWAPELQEHRVPDGDVFIEVLRPEAGLSLTVSLQTVGFERTRLPGARIDGWVFAAVDGMAAGTRDRIGDFYALVWRDAEGEWHRILDPMAASLPFGVFAPAEYYDLAALQAARADAAWFEAMEGEPAKVGPPTSILQIHVPTATPGMTLASLARHIEAIGEKYLREAELEPADRLFLGYDAVQLMPVEPTTVYEAGPDFWSGDALDADTAVVELRRPNTTNWGYDIVIAGMAAVNPALLESGRPDELVDLAAVLHNFPWRPKKLIFDVVFGHSDNQGLEALSRHYFAGANMYGQNINYRNWTVRAILLEMQRRKGNFGADGIRVDGAQDFKWWDADAEELRHDDEFLQEMADVVQEVAGKRYR